jgi:hypothetical protein
MSAFAEEIGKKGRRKKILFGSGNIPSSLSPIKAIQTSSLCGKGARFSERSRHENELSRGSWFSTVWSLGRSRGDKDKGTTNRVRGPA